MYDCVNGTYFTCTLSHLMGIHLHHKHCYIYIIFFISRNVSYSKAIMQRIGIKPKAQYSVTFTMVYILYLCGSCVLWTVTSIYIYISHVLRMLNDARVLCSAAVIIHLTMCSMVHEYL